MNFYIGMSVEKLDFNDYNIRIDEDIYEEYLYKGKYEFKKINKIDPYENTVLFEEDILVLIDDCDLVIDSQNISNEDFMKDIKELKLLCQKAISSNKNIICIGD